LVDKQLTGRQEIEEAIQHYIATRDSVTQRRILSRWVVISIDPATDHRKRRRTNEPEEPEERPDHASEERLDEAQDQEPGRVPDQVPNRELGQESNQESSQDPDKSLGERFGALRQQAVAFFAQRQKGRNQEGEPPKPALTWIVAQNALTALEDGHKWITENDVSDLWVSKDPVTADGPSEDISPLQRLAMLYESVLSSEHSNEVKRRLTALLIHHECQVNRIPVSKLMGKGKRKEFGKGKDWNCEFAKPTGVSFGTATDALNTAYAWIKFIKAWGLGGLVMPAPGYRYWSACPLADKKH
jgi:hypothetical protein